MGNIIKQGFIAQGTTCESCAEIIRHQAMKVDGVRHVEFNLEHEVGYVTFDPDATDIDKILDKIEEKGFECFILDEDGPAGTNNYSNRILGWTLGLLGLVVAGYFIFNLADGIHFPQISQNMGLGLLFLVGLLTGFHCVSMCGGFVVSYSTKDAQQGIRPHKSHLSYGLGKTISYTVIGAAFGLLGSIIAFTPAIRGMAGILAGLFLIIFGINMLNILPSLRRFRLRIPKSFAGFVNRQTSGRKSPLVIGLFNGLMIACGPLQAIYIMAAGTGSMIEGAKLLFVFALGTLPVMLSFGYITSIISAKAAKKILKASGAVVIVLGLIMINRGLALAGTGLDANTLLASANAEEITGNTISMQDGYQVIRMNVTRYGWEPDKFALKKDVPVRWIINGKEINGCNNAIQVPKYGLNFDIKPGEQTIEFTPTTEGIIPWSCWMGMIPGTFIVKENIDLSNQQAVQQELDSIPQQKRGSCGCGGR